MKALAVLLLGTGVASADPDPPATKLGGYVEVYGAFNTNDPANGVTNLRAFDDRSASFVLQNVMLEGTWTQGAVSGRLALQAGDAGDLYYQAEPVHPPAGSAPATGPEAFRHIQEAYFAWAAPDRIELAAGVFLSPIGPETVAEHAVWNWSRGNLFFALPFYHTGVRFKRPLGDSGWSVIAMVANGWNSIVDNNHTPSVDVIAAYSKGDWLGQVQYFGGVETTSWRHLFDAYVQGPLAPHLTLLVHGDAGFEPNASWAGGAAYLKLDLTKQWAAIARGDYLHDTHSILLPVEWVASGTATAQYQPTNGLLFRLELRHDQAASDAYFSGNAVMPDSRHQNTVTVGATAWF